MRNKIFTFLLAIIVSAGTIFAESGTCGKNVTWELSEDGVLTISGTGTMTNYSMRSVPWYKNREAVITVIMADGITNIGGYAFCNCTNLTSASIPNSVTSIGEGAFYCCTGLTSIEIPSGVTSIGNLAFINCSNLTSIDIPNNVTSIGNNAFNGCSSLKTMTIPDGIAKIEATVFYNCISLTAVTIPNNVTSIGNEAFKGCSSLTTVNIPNNLTYIGNSAFNGCPGVTSVEILNPSATIGENAFLNCPNLATVTINSNAIVSKSYSNSSNMATIFGSQVSKYIIGDKVTSIGQYAFYNCTGLTSIEIPSGVTSIGISAFYQCSSLHAVVIPDKITTIANYTFYGCSSLKEIIIPENVTTIGNQVFYNCSSLMSTNIPSKVTSIGSNAFANCPNLETVTLNSNAIVGKDYYQNSGYYFYQNKGVARFFGPQVTDYIIGEDVTSIGNCAFYCSEDNALSSITIGANVTSIGSYAFYGCKRLNSINIPNLVTKISNYVFSGCSSLKSVDIPNGVTSIGERAFSGCTALTSVFIPNNVKSIGDYAFYNCTGLTAVYINDIAAWCGISFGTNGANPLGNAHHLFVDGKEITELVIPDNVSQIGQFAFQGGRSLTSVTIHDKVTSIGTNAFYDCTGLTTVKLNSNAIVNRTYTADSNIKNIFGAQVLDYQLGDSITGIGSSAFNQCSNLISLSIGKSVLSIGTAAFNGCSSLTSVSLNSNTIVGKSYTKEANLCNIFGTKVAEYKIGQDVTSIGNYAFYNCTGLTSFTIPNSVTNIGASAFEGCTGLTSVTIPNSVINIGIAAFYNCTGLTAVHINDIAAWCGISFANNGGLSNNANPLKYAKHLYLEGKEITELVIPEGVINIGDYAFYYGTNLTSVVLPNSVKNIGKFAFRYCSNLTSVTIPNSVNSIGNYAFGDCTGLASITIPNSVTSIGSGAFRGCAGLTSIDIPNSVTSIGSGAFYNCSGLTAVHINDIAAWCGISFDSFDANPLFYAKHLYKNGEEIKDLIIPEGTTSINNYAFCGCSSLTSVTIPSCVTSIGESAFYGCSGLTAVDIPNSVTSIGDNAFYNVYSISYDGTATGSPWGALHVNAVSDEDFIYSDATKTQIIKCITSNEQVTIPEQVTSIATDAFLSCQNLKSIIWNIPNYPDFISAANNPLYVLRNNLTSFIFGNPVKHIPAYLCSGFNNIKIIDIPDNVTIIGDNAFEGCTNVRKVIIGANVKELQWQGGRGFSDCSQIDTVIWKAVNCADMEYSPFYYSRENIKEFIIADNITSIPANLCWGIKNITSLNVPSSVKRIGKDAFYGSGLQELVLPNTLQFVGGRAFYNCPLQKVIWDVPAQEDYDCIEETPDNITVSLDASNLGWGTVYLFAWQGNKLILGDWPGKKLEPDANGRYTYTFGSSYTTLNIIWTNGNDQTVDINGVTESGIYKLTSNSGKSIGYTTSAYLASKNSPFSDVTSVTDFTFGNSVKRIPAYLCKGMKKLTQVIVPNNVTKIGRSAFEGCSGVEEVTLGQAMSQIGEKAFKNCTHIADINSYAASKPEIQSNTFENVSRKAYVWVAANQIRKYETDAYWGEFFIKTKEAETTTTSSVQVTPYDNSANIVWPSVDNAATYELVIKDKLGNVICTLVFNANGQLTEISFSAPGRNAMQQTQSAGFSFTVTGLDSGEGYDLTLTSKDNEGKTLDEQVVSFTTQGNSPQAIDQVSQEPIANSQKLLINGQLYILRGDMIYNASGMRVK